LPWINGVLNHIGAADAVAAAGFVKKWGASFMSDDSETERYADFAQAPEVPQPQTYQVPRARFDQILLEHAAACGAVVRHNCQAAGAEFDADGATLTYTDADGGATAVRVRAIIDASGRYGFLARKFGQRRPQTAQHRGPSAVRGVRASRAGGRRYSHRGHGPTAAGSG
jgi:halogenation protein CepH